MFLLIIQAILPETSPFLSAVLSIFLKMFKNVLGIDNFDLTLNDFSDRLMNPREEVISDRVVELHFERSKDFGQDVQCFAANSAGRDSKRETIPGT